MLDETGILFISCIYHDLESSNCKKSFGVDVWGTRYDFSFWEVVTRKKNENTFRCSSFFPVAKGVHWRQVNLNFLFSAAWLDFSGVDLVVVVASVALLCLTMKEGNSINVTHYRPSMFEGIQYQRHHHHHHHHHHPKAFQFARNHQAFQPSNH